MIRNRKYDVQKFMKLSNKNQNIAQCTNKNQMYQLKYVIINNCMNFNYLVYTFIYLSIMDLFSDSLRNLFCGAHFNLC